MAKLIMSAFADEYSRVFDTQLAMLKEQGIDYLEPRFVDGINIAEFDSAGAKQIKEKLDANGIGISSIGSPLGKIKLSDDMDAHMEQVKRVCETANILDTKYVRMFSFYLHDGKTDKECRNEVIEAVGKMLDIADSAGVMMCHENEARIYGESPENCLDLLEAFGGRLRCVFDMGNFVLDQHKPYPDGYQMLKPYIEYFHIKDSMAKGAIVPPGCGEAHIEEILKEHIKDAQKDVFITLEPHLETFDGLNKLVGKNFENPYKFESKEAAFLDKYYRF